MEKPSEQETKDKIALKTKMDDSNIRSGEEEGLAPATDSEEKKYIEAIGQLPVFPGTEKPKADESKLPGFCLTGGLIGETFDMDDVMIFQRMEATATDIESLVTLERAAARFKERVMGGTNPLQQVAVIVVAVILIAVAILIIREMGLLPFVIGSLFGWV